MVRVKILQKVEEAPFACCWGVPKDEDVLVQLEGRYVTFSKQTIRCGLRANQNAGIQDTIPYFLCFQTASQQPTTNNQQQLPAHNRRLQGVLISNPN
jgi:hypothetical protein